MILSLCDGWEFSENWSEEFLSGKKAGVPVRLPHTVHELPLHYALNEEYEMVCGYRRKLVIPDEYAGKKLLLRFDGAGHIADVFINGKPAATHRCGYTAFTVDITDLVSVGENTLTVRLDATENGAVPPFGFVIDYLTYGGLYREVWLEVRPQTYIEDVFVQTPDLSTVKVIPKLNGPDEKITVKIYGPDGALVCEETGNKSEFCFKLSSSKPWSVDEPNLYRCEVTAGEDVYSTNFGIRTAEFKADGFYLNGKKTFLRGLNRHQCWPYIGYAAPESLQREDARILKEELSCTAVRTSHYPQSQHFIDECDRLGLCVFTEIPGWQHIGDDKWQEQACYNVREMILQYRNHPSIVLWGVRINESVDNDEFYKKTNAIAHELDPTRQTSGVRYIEKSHLLEDVYAFNDFSHNGETPGCRPKSKVTMDMGKGFLISEHSGHMFPTKSFDPWMKRQEHALRHARVLDAAMADGDHAGCFGWCMFDYNTHKDFGSGDRICYHGVMDAFRNPKLAASVYASQGDRGAVLDVGSSFDIGDYPGGQAGEAYIFTNADEVKLYKNGNFVTEYRPTEWKALPHGPIAVTDTIGDLLRSQEGFTGAKEKLMRDCLIATGKYGMSNLPLSYKMKLGYAMLKYKMSFQDGVDLYGKYIGNWGGEATRWRFDAYKDGKLVKSVTKAPGNRLHIEAVPSKSELTEGDTYDMAAVRIRVLDDYDNIASYAQLPIELETEGEIELVGPSCVTAEGGMCGAYLKTTGAEGKGLLKINAAGLEAVEIQFEIKIREER